MATRNDAITLQTRLSPSECQARLVNAVDRPHLAFTISGYAGTKQILGNLNGTRFRLQARRNYRNGSAPLFYGQLVPDEAGTIIQGEFRLHPIAVAFHLVWFFLCAAFFLAALITSSKSKPLDAAVTLLTPVLMAAFVFGIVKFGRWLARNEVTAIKNLLKTTLEAREALPVTFEKFPPR